MSRRRFLMLAGLLPAAAAVGPSLLRAADAVPCAGKRLPLALELWSVRKELERDLNGTLKSVAGIGYEAVEFFGSYFAWTPAKAREVRKLLDDLGVKCHSTHNGFNAFTGDGVAKAAELNAILGSRFVVLAAPPKVEGADGWKKLSEQLTQASHAFKQQGIAAGYHNHGWEWEKLENGQRAMDIVAANTPNDFVLQLDVGTCVDAGQDPVAWIRSHPGRTRVIHLKDWAKGREEDNKGYRVLFGEGDAPWREIFAAAESVGGLEVYVMEQEGSRYSEFESARRCLENWKKMRGA